MMETKSVIKVIKIGTQENMQNFLMKGEMFFNTVDEFRKQELNQERYDDHEGAQEIEQVNWIKIQAEDGKLLEFSRENQKHNRISSAYLLKNDGINRGNIYCCSAVTQDTIENFKKLDSRFKEFGDTLILIENINSFFDRVENELKRNNLEYKIGLVNYYDPKKENRALSLFDKKISLSYQNELRIWIKNASNIPLKICIGPINDIAIEFKISALICQ